jgi:hypothetical protein
VFHDIEVDEHTRGVQLIDGHAFGLVEQEALSSCTTADISA